MGRLLPNGLKGNPSPTPPEGGEYNERWVNDNGRSDTRYNSINSYAMLHVRYRLNMFGGKVDTEGRYDKKWGNRDRR